MGFYSRAKQGISDAGLDLLDLARAFENSYQDRSFKAINDGVREYLNTQHAGTVLTAAPLGAAVLGGGLGLAEAGIAGAGAAIAAPFAGDLFYRKQMRDAIEAEEVIQRKVDEIDGRLKSRVISDVTDPWSDTNEYFPSISAEEANDLQKQRAYLKGNREPNAKARTKGIRNKQRAVGGAATAAAIALASMLNRRSEPQAPDTTPYPPQSPQYPPYTVQPDILTLNADFSDAPTAVVPPVKDDLLAYWNVG